jgi:D-alanyl-D-alanine carboxypeptidase
MVIIVVVIVAVGGIATYFTLNLNNNSTANNTAKLQDLVTTSWATYERSTGYTSGTGGVALYITSPKGNYFVSTNMSGASPDIHFRIASNTKTFTAAAIMLLYQEGKLNIDDPITANMPGKNIPYVPNSANYSIPYKNQITIRELLGHRAGVFDVANDLIPQNATCPYAGQFYLASTTNSTYISPHQYTLDELVGVNAQCHLSYFPPGTGYHYSNTGYTLLAKIIEDVSGMSYSQFVMHYLMAPNGLSSTSSPNLASDTKLPAPFASGYVLVNSSLVDVTEDDMSSRVAEGNVISTPRNLATWISNLITGKAGIEKNYVETMMNNCTSNPGNSAYGLGISYLSAVGYGHAGATAGYLSFMYYDPDNNVTLVMFTNLWISPNLSAVIGEIRALSTMAQQARSILGYSGPAAPSCMMSSINSLMTVVKFDYENSFPVMTSIRSSFI